MKFFITRVWGFEPERWPVIAFGLEGNWDKFLKESAPGDRIVFVATLREPTPEALRGRFLGMAEIGRSAVNTLDVIGEDTPLPQDYDSDGGFRWPKAVLMVRAWRFVRQPMLTDVLSEQLPYHATSQAILLSPADSEAVLKLESEEAALPETEVPNNARLLDKALSIEQPTTGLKPSTWTGETGRNIDREAFTYALQFGQTDIWKIGHTIDIPERLKQVNCHIPPEVVPERWDVKFQQLWGNEAEAYAMEQRVLAALDSCRTEGERVRCSEAEIRRAWIKGIGAT